MGLGWVIDGQSHSRDIAAALENTNNVAEYLALIEVLKHAIEHENENGRYLRSSKMDRDGFQALWEFADVLRIVKSLNASGSGRW